MEKREPSEHISKSRHLALHWLVLREYLNRKGDSLEERKLPDGFLRRDFSYGEAQRRKGEERVVSYADERFRAATKPNGKDRSKMLFENYTEEEMT